VASQRLFASFLVGWPVAVLFALSSRLAFGATASATDYAAWLLLASVPPTIAWVISLSRQTLTVAQLLYDAEHSNDGA
jgi:hypothetical protein